MASRVFRNNLEEFDTQFLSAISESFKWYQLVSAPTLLESRVVCRAGAHVSRARDARRPSRSRHSRRAFVMVRPPPRRRVASPAPCAHAARRARRCPPIAAAAVRRPFSIRDRVGATEARVGADRRAIEARNAIGGRHVNRLAYSRVRPPSTHARFRARANTRSPLARFRFRSRSPPSQTLSRRQPTVNLNRDRLFAALGKTYTEEAFDELCFEFGIELDEVTSEKEMNSKFLGDASAGAADADASDEVIYKIDIPANRYDLLCHEGISKALNVFMGRCPSPTFRLIEPANGAPRQKMVVKPETLLVRPFVVCAVLR
mgnify:CR=1 FL=1